MIRNDVINLLSSLPGDSLCLKQERLLREIKKPTETNLKGNCPTPFTVDVPPIRSKAPTPTEVSKPVSNNLPSSSTLSAPLLTKKAKIQEGGKAEIDKTTMVNEAVKVKHTGDDTSEKEGKVGAIRQVEAPHRHDLSMKLSNKQQINKLEASLGQLSRPSNPFLKSSIK